MMIRNIRYLSLLLAVLAASGTASAVHAQEVGRAALPAPTGPGAVGVVHRIVTDPGREGGSASAGRELPVVIWYPAERGTGEVGVYLDALDVRAQVLGEAYVEDAGGVRPNARARARPDTSGGPFPVIVVSHSLGGIPGLYAGLGEELASRGYVVASVGHPGGAAALAIGDTVVTLSGAWEENDPSRVGIEQAFAFRETQAKQWATDVLYVVSRLPGLGAAGTWMAAVADTSRVGYVGHSVGGSAAAAGCAMSSRFDACVNLDGWPLPPDAEDGLEQPYLHVEETRPYRSDAQLEEWGATRARYDRNMAGLAARKDSLYQAMEATSYHLVIDGLTHQGFSDRVLWDERARERQRLEPERGLAVLRNYVGWFLGRHVRGDGELQPPDPVGFSEVRFTAYGADWSQDRPSRKDSVP